MKYNSSAATNKPTTVAAKNKKARTQELRFQCKNTPENVNVTKGKAKLVLAHVCWPFLQFLICF